MLVSGGVLWLNFHTRTYTSIRSDTIRKKGYGWPKLWKEYIRPEKQRSWTERNYPNAVLINFGVSLALVFGLGIPVEYLIRRRTRKQEASGGE